MLPNIDIAKTKDYYEKIPANELCDCAYCVNFRKHIRAVYPALTAYLDSLGVDIEKPLETTPLEPDKNHTLLYACVEYPVIGTCESDFETKIGDTEIRVGTSYPTPDPEPGDAYFVLDCFSINLPFSS